MQKIRKKYQTVKAVGPELTYLPTYVPTDESEFIGSFRSLKTSGEPTNKQTNKILLAYYIHHSTNAVAEEAKVRSQLV